MEEEDSRALLQSSAHGDDGAVATLMHSYYHRVRAFVRVHMSAPLRAYESADDLVQSAFGDALRGAQSFRWRGEEAFRAWLFTTVRHKILSHERLIRAQRRDVRRRVPLESSAELGATYQRLLGPSDNLIQAERIRLVESAFDKLPDHYREVITLARFAQLSRTEVARVMGRTEDSIRNLLPRALATLASELLRAGFAPDEPGASDRHQERGHQ